MVNVCCRQQIQSDKAVPDIEDHPSTVACSTADRQRQARDTTSGDLIQLPQGAAPNRSISNVSASKCKRPPFLRSLAYRSADSLLEDSPRYGSRSFESFMSKQSKIGGRVNKTHAATRRRASSPRDPAAKVVLGDLTDRMLSLKVDSGQRHSINTAAAEKRISNTAIEKARDDH
ncbi:hypothetical protein CKAH01_10377 [Colletotrichum kahawae]|uniref:Uncharacterized protein n=1 Tax=Colletotrichum kahawae TaxID=34407 RepID=A0AAD9XW64_COLKA|nr:hypothetical protein CKAH01_10377 [Colletotrichum kahawae]